VDAAVEDWVLENALRFCLRHAHEAHFAEADDFGRSRFRRVEPNGSHREESCLNDGRSARPSHFEGRVV